MIAHLAEFLSLVAGQEGTEGLETGVDALHAPPLVAVGDLPPYSLLCLHRVHHLPVAPQSKYTKTPSLKMRLIFICYFKNNVEKKYHRKIGTNKKSLECPNLTETDILFEVIFMFSTDNSITRK